jgi:hypothetical protein
VECHFIEAAIHQSGNALNGLFIKFTSSSNFQNCKQNFSKPLLLSDEKSVPKKMLKVGDVSSAKTIKTF